MGQDLQNLPGTAFNGDHRVYSNFFGDNDIIQQVCITQPKNLLIDVLRKYFSNDSIFTFRMDEFGYPLTRDLTGIEIDSEETTQILISDIFRYEVKFYPAIIIKNSGGQYKPISFNQNATFKYRKDRVEDAAGLISETLTPSHRVYAGAWSMNFDVSVYSESQTELEELVDIVTLLLQYVAWNELRANGLFINSLSIGAESAEPYANDYVYNQTISLTTYSEWRVEIPLDNVIEKLLFYFDSVRTPIPGVATDADALELKYDDILELAEIS
nr:hypothetical protein 93 [bacterium]